MKRLTLLFLCVAVAGCGSTTTSTVTVSRSTPSTSPTSTALPASSGSTTTSSPSGPPVHLATFKSPSGNIGCMIIAGTARCDIRQRSWSPPPRPSSCPSQVDFGQGLIVGRHGAGRLVCAGDTSTDPSAPALRYGADTLVAGFRCQSRTSGITCTRVAGGHGFFISIQSYRTF